ncbi:MAG: hypothetical protein K1X64_21125 [Myxococcaceae bacterium]|nr:hypothetical protein [Myxococcaceae bacterium]
MGVTLLSPSSKQTVESKPKVCSRYAHEKTPLSGMGLCRLRHRSHRPDVCGVPGERAEGARAARRLCRIGATHGRSGPVRA